MQRRRVLTPLALAALVAGLAAPAASPAAGAATTQAAGVSLAQSALEDTALGTAMTVDVPGGGYAVVNSFGEISMVGASGAEQWQVDSQQLYQDWNLSWQQQQVVVQYPQLPWGTDPVNPLDLSGPATGLVNDVHPAAAGELGGRPVVAVAETAGINISSDSFCFGCSQTWPFNVPGSGIHIGTFVNVLDARTGRMLYHELDPGYVTQLAIADGRLIVGDEDGDPQSEGGIGQWGGVSTVRALAVSAGGTARQAWEYSTGVPWGRLLDVTVTGASAGRTAGGSGQGVAIAWSDTPLGLGVPGPPNGHLLLLDAATGAARWQVRTPGYPVLTAADDHSSELAVVQASDPTLSVGYTLTGLRYSNGTTRTSVPRAGALPLSLAVGSGDEDGWAVGAVDATIGNGVYTATEGRVTLASPATGRELWSATLPANDVGTPLPGGVAVTGGEVIAGAWFGAMSPTAADPISQDESLTALSYQTGQTKWQDTGDPGDPLSLSAVNGGPGLVRAVTSHQIVETYKADGQASQSTAGPGDFLSGTTASISSPGSTDLVAGNENGDVYAFDGKALAAGTQKVLWRAHLPGPVQNIETTTLGGRRVLVAAATSAVGVIAVSTGQVLRVIPTEGRYAYTATVIDAAGTPGVVVPGNSLTAYSLTTGASLWSYAAPPGSWFSGAAYADGVVAAEYSGASSFGSNGLMPSANMAAIGLNAATGAVAWTAPAASGVANGDLYNGAFASPDIAGAGGDGVAFAWYDTDFASQVDVRNIVTGAVDYTHSSYDLSAFSQFLASPSLGLIAVSQNGAALVTPSGAESSFWPSGTSASLATTTSGQQALLTANNGVMAFGTDIFTDSSASSEASAATYLSGTLVAGDFAGNGTQQAVAMPTDALAYQIVFGETGGFLFPNLSLAQHGLAVVSLQDASTSSAAAQASAAAKAAAGVRAGAAQAPSAAATDLPAALPSIPAGLRPVGQSGSNVPAIEPGHNGSVRSGTSPATIKHTLTASAADPAVTPPGYSPAQMNAYLGLAGDGKGQKIAIVDAYNDPDITSDAETFSQQYGLPGVCGAGGTAGDCFTLDATQQSASASSNPNWALETSLDVEWAHAIAPDATIELFEAQDSTLASLFSEVAAAEASRPDAVSMSWGYSGGEFSDEAYYDHFCAVRNTVCVVSSGDLGHPGSYPAYNPAAVAVGGTTLNLTATGAVTSEQAWAGSGGGQSWVEREPAYQDQAQSSRMRQIPDVAFDADLNTGVAVYDSVPYFGQSGWWEVGGTSVGAPSWSAILADADQLRAGQGEPPLTAARDAVQKALYSLPASVLAPVTTGADNGFCPVGCAPGPGYDEITGLGSPRAGIDTALADAPG